MNSEYCIVTDLGFVYKTYDEWINNHFPIYREHFIVDHNINDIVADRLYKIIGHAPHGDCPEIELYLIQDWDTKQVFIVEKEGIVITTHVTVTKNTNTIYCDDSLDATRYTYNIRGGEGNMNNEIVDLYYERKIEEIKNKYVELLKKEYEELEVVKEYKELVNTFEASLAELANRHNTEENRVLVKTGYTDTYTYELNVELKDTLKDARREEYDAEIKALQLLVEEVRAVLSISDTDEYRIGVLTEYGIITKKGKLNV